MRLKRIALTFFLCAASFAPTITAAQPTNFVPLDKAIYQNSSLNDLYNSNGPSGGSASFGFVFNHFWTIALSIGAFLAVIKIIQAGFLYQGGDFWDKKQRAKEMIQDVILGLFILFGAWLILYQINPCILDLGRLLKDFGGSASSATRCVPY